MIVVNDVHKRYQTPHGAGRWILKGVSFSIPSSVSVGLVGRNGAGKSTLLNLIGGVDTPTRGTVNRYCRVSWPMGYGGLQGSLTGRQNAKFVCRLHGFDAPQAMTEKIAYIEDFAELGSSFDEPVRTYSAGMKSRLQFGLSLALILMCIYQMKPLLQVMRLLDKSCGCFQAHRRSFRAHNGRAW